MLNPGSANVYANLGFRDAEECLLKAKLATKNSAYLFGPSGSIPMKGCELSIDPLI